VGAIPIDGGRDGVSQALLFHGDGSLALRWSQDVEPVLVRNGRLRDRDDGYSRSRELRRVASIPAVVQLAWIRRYGADPLAKGNEALLRRLLNDPEWRYLRTAPGRV